MTITYMAPKLRQALDDMQISRVKRTAVTVHDNASRVTPNLRQSTTTALRCVCAINWHVVVQHDIDFLWSILRTLVKAVRFQLKFWKIPGFSRAFICVIAAADFCAALWQKHKGSKGGDMHQQGKWKRNCSPMHAVCSWDQEIFTAMESEDGRVQSSISLFRSWQEESRWRNIQRLVTEASESCGIMLVKSITFAQLHQWPNAVIQTSESRIHNLNCGIELQPTEMHNIVQLITTHKFCILHNTVVIFWRCGGQVLNHSCEIYSGFCVPEIIQIGWQNYFSKCGHFWDMVGLYIEPFWWWNFHANGLHVWNGLQLQLCSFFVCAYLFLLLWKSSSS